MDKAQKRQFVDRLRQVMDDAGVIVVSHNLGLTASQMNELRAKMAEAGATLRVTKNRLTKIALEGLQAQGLAALLSGPTVLGFSGDPVTAPKVLADFAKKNGKLKLLGGALEASVLDAEGVKTLADLPSIEVLRARLIGVIQAPAARAVGVLQAPAGQLARVFGAYADKDAKAA